MMLENALVQLTAPGSHYTAKLTAPGSRYLSQLLACLLRAPAVPKI
jgi:hypothetical protein